MVENWVIKGCKSNQERAQRELYLSYGPVVKSICIRYIKDEQIAGDIFHDCFLKILDVIKKFDQAGSFEGWLKRVSVNFCLDYLRKTQRVKFVETSEDIIAEEEIEGIEKNEIDSEVANSVGFTQEDLKMMLQKLPEIYSVVFSLHQIEKYSHKEIGELLKIEEKTSRSRLGRARKKLKEILIQETKERLKA